DRELRHVRLALWQFGAELAHNSTDPCQVTTKEAGGVPPSGRLRDTTGSIAQSSRTGGGLTISWGEPQTTRATVSPTSHTKWRAVTKFDNTEQQRGWQTISIDF